MKLKVFELRCPDGEKEWIADYTNIGALITYILSTHTDLLDMDSENEIVEVPEHEWQELLVTNLDPESPDDWQTKTIAELMQEHTLPGVIASTMYL